MCNVKQGLCTALLKRDMKVSYQLTYHQNHICEDDELLTLQLETLSPGLRTVAETISRNNQQDATL